MLELGKKTIQPQICSVAAATAVKTYSTGWENEPLLAARMPKTA